METAADIIKSALQEILVQASEAPIQADEAQDAMRYMNRLMSQYDAQGISLGYTKVTSLGDDVTIPDGAINGLVFNLAISLAKQYDAVVSPSLATSAADGFDAMKRLASNIMSTSFGSTLPVGSGNQGNGICNDPFYSDRDTAVLTENGAFISVESGTILP